jgi:hypothetical protein
MTCPDRATVFIVDDDDRVRAAMQRLLKTVPCILSLLPRRRISFGTDFQTSPA